MKMLTDNAIPDRDHDEFGFRAYADMLADTIRDTDKLPFCIGIFAEWGAGKCSFMNMIKDSLSNDPSNSTIRTIWFNPWKYDKKEDLWNALIQSILYQIAEDDTNNAVAEKAKELAKSTAWMLLKKGVSTLTAGVLEGGDIEKLKDAFVKQDEHHYRHVNHFEADFREVVKLYTNDGKLVVFVDDLDRCLPQNAITVLESLKLFVGDAKCVFVLGMDHYIVEAGLNLRFGNEIKMSGRDYVDKIIQVPFFLPPVPFERLKESLQVSKTAQYSGNIWRVIEFGLKGNPRKTKRFVNCFYLLNEILRIPAVSETFRIRDSDNATGIPHEFQDFYLAKLLIFQMTFTEFYTHLKIYPDAWQLYEEKLINAQSFEDRDRVFNEEMPSIEPFWKNEYLKAFMANTAGKRETGFPIAPNRSIVESLIKAIDLVSRSSEQEQSSSSSSSSSSRQMK